MQELKELVDRRNEITAAIIAEVKRLMPIPGPGEVGKQMRYIKGRGTVIASVIDHGDTVIRFRNVDNGNEYEHSIDPVVIKAILEGRTDV